MERYAWKATVLPGKLDEYVRRHNAIWPELKEVLHQAGIRNLIKNFCHTEKTKTRTVKNEIYAFDN